MNRQGYTYLSNLVRAGEEDRWLAVQYAPFALRLNLLPLYATHVEIRRVPTLVKEPALGEIRLQWWREALREITNGGPVRRHPVIEALSLSGILNPTILADLNRAIDARSRLFYHDRFQNIDDLLDWLRSSEVYIDSAAGSLSGVDSNYAQAVSDAGLAFALARETAALAPDLVEEAVAIARDLYHRARPILHLTSGGGAPALLHFSLTEDYLKSAGNRRRFTLRKRTKIFLSMLTGRV